MSEANPLKIVIVGHVDHGKSTLVGRMFYETDSLEEGKYESVKKTCEKRGVPFEWAFLMDALQAERNQNVTIDTAQIWFETDLRPYVIIDAPGHKEFLKNMVTGAASADSALLLIAADEGVQEQSRRHGHMLSMLGIDQVTVVINKMDLVDYDEETYNQIVDEYSEFLHSIDIEPRRFVPTSARDGDNLTTEPTENMPWWEGMTVVEALDDFDRPDEINERPLRFPIQDIYRFDNRRILAGRIESGQLEKGQELMFTPHQKKASVETIERWSAPPAETAETGESIGVTLSKEIFVERGHIASDVDNTPTQTTRFRANLFWLGTEPLKVGDPYKLKLSTISEECTVTSIERIMDGANLEPIDEDRDQINRYDVAETIIETRRPIALDTADHHPTIGRFVIVDDYDVAGGGIVVEIDEAPGVESGVPERVTPSERASRRGHRGGTLRVRGQNAEEVAVQLERALFERGINALYLSNLPEDAPTELLSTKLAQSGTVAIRAEAAEDAETSDIEIQLDDARPLAVPANDDIHGAGVIEELVPRLREEEIEKRIEASAE